MAHPSQPTISRDHTQNIKAVLASNARLACLCSYQICIISQGIGVDEFTGPLGSMHCLTSPYLSTIRSHIEAMGGQLEVVARFPGPDGSVKITNFVDLDSVGAA